jgi:hypothetical protein
MGVNDCRAGYLAAARSSSLPECKYMSNHTAYVQSCMKKHNGHARKPCRARTDVLPTVPFCGVQQSTHCGGMANLLCASTSRVRRKLWSSRCPQHTNLTASGVTPNKYATPPRALGPTRYVRAQPYSDLLPLTQGNPLGESPGVLL